MIGRANQVLPSCFPVKEVLALGRRRLHLAPTLSAAAPPATGTASRVIGYYPAWGIYGRSFEIAEDTLRGWTDPASAVASRVVTGGPAPAPMRDMLDGMTAKLAADAAALDARQTHLRDSAHQLSERISAFLG